jgi:hypothetical protein
MRIKLNIIYFLLLFMCGCITSTPYNMKKEKNIIKNWKLDTLGCLGYRNINTSYYLIDSLNLKGKNKDFLIRKIGLPNYSQKTNNTETFKYYFNTTCKNGVFIDSIDYCWLELFIISNKIESLGIICY